MIEYRDVDKRFGEQVVLDGVNLSVRRGETLTIVGRSGTGKSVMLRTLTGLMPVDAGRIFVDGDEVTALDEDDLRGVRRKIGMLFQNAALFDSMTICENVAYPLKEHTDFDEAKRLEVAQETLEMVDLHDVGDDFPGELSGGMRKRVGLARAIALRPPIVLYDEPTTGLDPITSNVINRLIRRLQERLTVTSIVVTHDLESAFFMTDRIAMLHAGKIISVQSVEEFRHAQDERIHEFATGGLTEQELRTIGRVP
ncbi:MAG: ABC transporter ATP-binding protein [Candidatus Coatesbacteria bacterium]|nr:ABC transporter ATP-binding protein [Candidatus Coatesbacteria bacterium]